MITVLGTAIWYFSNYRFSPFFDDIILLTLSRSFALPYLAFSATAQPLNSLHILRELWQGFDSELGQTKNLKIGIHSFPA